MGGKIRREVRKVTDKEESHHGADKKAEPVEERERSVEKDQMEFLRRRSLDNTDFPRGHKNVITGDKKDND